MSSKNGILFCLIRGISFSHLLFCVVEDKPNDLAHQEIWSKTGLSLLSREAYSRA